MILKCYHQGCPPILAPGTQKFGMCNILGAQPINEEYNVMDFAVIQH